MARRVAELDLERWDREWAAAKSCFTGDAPARADRMLSSDGDAGQFGWLFTNVATRISVPGRHLEQRSADANDRARPSRRWVNTMADERVAVGTKIAPRPRTDPYVRNNRIRLLLLALV